MTPRPRGTNPTGGGYPTPRPPSCPGSRPSTIAPPGRRIRARTGPRLDGRAIDRPSGPGPWERPPGPQPGRRPELAAVGSIAPGTARQRPTPSWTILARWELYRPGSKPSARVTASQGGNFKNLAIKTGIALDVSGIIAENEIDTHRTRLMPGPQARGAEYIGDPAGQANARSEVHPLGAEWHQKKAAISDRTFWRPQSCC